MVTKTIDIQIQSDGQLRKILTKKRLSLLLMIKHESPKSIYALAKLAERDYGNVHRDTELLKRFDIVDTKNGLRVKADKLRFELSLKPQKEDAAGTSTALRDFCKQNDISFLGVFGSRASGRHRADSDLDLLAEFDKKKGLVEFAGIERKLGVLFGKKVDLVTKKGLSRHVKKPIMARVRPLYERG